jgi:L-alanine-DL-glutamate epimerase-like enolase superfamily enzyme
MKITGVEDMHCDAGWRDFSFFKITTDDGHVGWAEYLEGQYGGGNGGGVSALLRFYGTRIKGRDPLMHEAIIHDLRSLSIQVVGGVAWQAQAVIENCLLDIKGKALGVPVSTLLGGAMRDKLPVYWSHCGNARLNHSEMLGVPPLRNLDDVKALGAEVAAKGLKGLKCNLFHGETLHPLFPVYRVDQS